MSVRSNSLPHISQPLSSVPCLHLPPQDFFSGCSYGKVDFTSANNVIVGPVDVPCSGRTKLGAWSSRTCGFSDVHGWAIYVDTWAKEVSQHPSPALGSSTTHPISFVPDANSSLKHANLSLLLFPPFPAWLQPHTLQPPNPHAPLHGLLSLEWARIGGLREQLPRVDKCESKILQRTQIRPCL